MSERRHVSVFIGTAGLEAIDQVAHEARVPRSVVIRAMLAVAAGRLPEVKQRIALAKETG